MQVRERLLGYEEGMASLGEAVQRYLSVANVAIT